MDIEPELQKRLSDSLEHVSGWLQEAEGLAREQVPLIINELLAWGWWKAATTLAALAIAFAVIATVFALTVKKAKWNDPEVNPWFFVNTISAILLLFTFVGLMIVGSQSVATMIQITVAPRVYLLNQLGILK